MSLKIEHVDEVRLTFTMPRGDLAVFPTDDGSEPSRDDYLEEMLHHIVLNHGRRLRGAIFEPLMEGMLEPGEDVIDHALVQELRHGFEGALRARLSTGRPRPVAA
ncbi:hypothetical protein roselon_00607 [Roseibacterium elongatum DSM 19469]|uniref:Uncharacterized protein n=1 Tax=Roseicyclus elongatus DSM 19469 TaxID=1294273 RepID=W8RYW3_9RHOB|nr:hypothetical protein [Roseibacterium elongatum]AHM03047.1 hypothetical protein roselon_00607 [Roseibacterium elongatum DSM 19469]